MMVSADELHVVYGTGPVGTAVITELLARGKRVRVVTRSGARKHLPPQVEMVRGDATDPADARRACADATHVYNCANPLDYHRWPEQFPPLQQGVLEGAAANGARLIVMENLYMYGPHGGAPMRETTPMHGRGPRSSTRAQMTEALFAAHTAGRVQATSVRAADLFGPYVTESLVGERLFGPLLAGKPAQLFANLDVPHSVSYIGDVGRALVTVGADERALGRAWHVPNAPAVTLRQFAQLLGEEAGIEPKLQALPRPVTRALLPILGLFTPPLRGLEENLYIGYEPYIVDHSAYAQLFGNHASPLRAALRTTVQWYREGAATAQPTAA
ncbi:MAG: NAD-dependent epimerase/dehydratase family protein [Chloroflexales bacterium]|nr:NAD-dependent epimerase/dehydratase family protein [Chloroflexales bacterium]